ncbi:MAG: hypothetical protein ISQ32_04655 [Rickettsiales bacterium]|nr:hypothetical protein [Rickettsiales bacterium]
MRRIESSGKNLHLLGIPETKEFNPNEFKRFYNKLLKKTFGCCFNDIDRKISLLNETQQISLYQIFNDIIHQERLSEEKTNEFLEFIKLTYNNIFSQIKENSEIDFIKCSADNFESYRNEINKLPRLLFILRDINKLNNNTETIKLSYILLKLTLNHLILPESIKQRIQNSQSHLGDTLESIYTSDSPPSIKFFDVLFCGHTGLYKDNFSCFKNILISNGSNHYLMFTPIIGLDAANIYYSSAPLDYSPDGAFKYFDYFQDQQKLVAISALSQNHSEISSDEFLRSNIPLTPGFKETLRKTYSEINHQANIIESYIYHNKERILSLELTKSIIKKGEKTLIFYELPEINDLFYGHRFTQELISECLLAISQDMQRNNLKEYPLIVNCEKGTNRSKAIYEAMIELKYQKNSELKTASINCSLPETMTHFFKANLDDYIYIGNDNEGSKISLLRDFVINAIHLNQGFER